jgi:amino acid adenylation domain-containing protein
VKTVKARLILTGRSPFPARNRWREWLETHASEDRTSLKINQLQELEKLGGEILVFSSDVTDKEKMQEVVDLAMKQWGKINGVIHAAGVPDGSIIQRKKPGDIEPVLAPKIKGTLVLDAVFQDMDSPLDFIIYCSSLHSFLGKMGQVAYAAANEFLDAYAYYKNLNCPDQTYIVSINWDAWQEVGMAADAVSNKQGIFPTEGLEVFKRILGSKNKFFQVAVSVSDLNRLIRGVQSSKKLIDGKTAEKSIVPGERYSRPELSTGYAAPRDKLEEEIVGIWQEYFGIREIGIHDNFFELGGDSLKGMKFVSSYNRLLGEIVYINAVFEAPTPAELSAYLQKHYPEAVKKVLGAGPEQGNRTRCRGLDREMIEKISRVLPSSLPPKEETGKKIVKNPPAVFILSPPRSGSTLLRVMLAGHPRLFAPPELGLLFFNTLDEVDFTLQSLIRAIMQIKNCSVEEAKGIIDRYRQQRLTSKQFYLWLQEEIGERILVDKTPNYALNPAVLERTEQEFENPLYIYLLRHPYGMIRSYEEAKLDLIKGDRILEKLSLTRREYAELTWLINHQNIIEFLKKIPDRRQYKVIFEDLVTRPREIITGICGFLGLDVHPDMLRPYKDKKQRMTDGIYSEGIMIGDVKFHRHKKIDPNVAHTWKQHFHDDFLGQPTWEIAEFFGYSRINKESKESVKTYIPLESIEKKEYYPLSPAQTRLYILERLGSGIGYNISRVLALEGQLEIKELQKIFKQIIIRHESFRTSFELIRGEPVQRIHREVEFEIEYYKVEVEVKVEEEEGSSSNCQGRGEVPSPIKVKKIIRDFIRDFDLSRAPLLRIGLIKTAQNKYLLVKDMHHIISDGGSMGILIRDFAALCENKELPLLRIRYRDYAQWQNSSQRQDAIKKQEQYWTGLFAGDIPVLNIPTDFPRPSRQDFEGATSDFRIDKQEFTLLKNMAVQEGATFFMVILSIFNILLGKLSGQEDIIVGIDMEGRGHEHLRDIIGMFANTLALRNFLAPGKTFKEFLRQVKHQTLNAFENREYPFEELVEKVSIERNVSRNPVFDVLFSFLDLKSGGANQEIQWSRSQLKMKPFNYQNSTAKFDLTLIAREREEDVTFSIEYCTKLFRKETIRRYGQYLKNIVSAVIADRAKKISQIRIITDEEKKQVLFEFNHTKTPLVRDKNYPQLFEEQEYKHPHRIAALHNKTQITYHELNKQADRIAGVLLKHGVIAGTNTALYLKRGIAMLAGIIGIFKAGGASVPLEVDYPPARVRYILENSEARVVITENDYLEILKETQGTSSSVTLEKSAILIKSFCGGSPDASRGRFFQKAPPLAAGGKSSADTLAYIIYTSGTTGEPKGVMIHQLGMINHLYAKIDDLGINRADIIAQTASACFDISVWQFLAGLLTGGRTCIIDREAVLESRKLLRLLQQRCVTILETVPSLMKAFLETAANETDNALDRLRWMVPTGEPLTVPLVRAWFRVYPHIKLVNAYGPTEASDDVTHFRIDKMPPETETSIPIGKPLQNLHIYILDRDLSLCPVGVKGEICVSGIGVGKGYWRDPRKTGKAFIRNPYLEETGDMDYEWLYKTGDLGYFKPDGNIECLGRMDYQVKIRGNRVELGEIESRLLAHSRIKEVVVVDRIKPGGDLYLCAYIVSKQPEALGGQPQHTDINGHMPTDSTLREYLAQSLPAYMIPSYFVQMEKLPLTPNQKIDREALPEPGIPESSRQYIPPGDEIQEIVVHMCAQVLALEKEKISITDDFFRMGGNSLEAVKFVALAKKELNVEMPIAALFERPVIKDISMFIKAEKYEEKPAVLLNPDIPAQKNLFCFPPGGAYGLVYREFAAVIKNISVYTCHFIEEEDRLEQYVRIITDIQPEGPYVVLGYSAAGKLVFQVTRALENHGREVSDIILVDSVFRKDIDEKKIIDKYTAFINAILERMDDLGIGFLKERIKDKMQKYLKYNLSITNLEKVHANVQFIVGEETARGKAENLHCWDDLTTKKVVLHKGFGDHISMFQPGVLEKNTAIIQGILNET